MLTLHHLGISQSERIVWLLEELGLPYDLVVHRRAPALAPASLKAVPGNRAGRAPFLVDSGGAGVALGESGAIAEYILSVYGADGRPKLRLLPGEEGYAEYLYWFHWANASLQPEMVNNMFGASNDALRSTARRRLNGAWAQLDERLGETGKWLAGEEFTAADIMTVYPVTTQRYWGPQDDLGGYKNIVRWVRDVAERPAYQRAMEKGDPEMRLLTGAEAPRASLMTEGGVESNLWRKAS